MGKFAGVERAPIETVTALDRATAEAFDPQQLELILLPTERCNFRCTYCYEDFVLGKMCREIIEAVKLLLYARLDDLRSLHLSWFGGEPLLARDIVHEINEFAASLYARKDYTSSITTNGFLLNPAEFARLLGSGMRHFQISLDGLREDHDAARPAAGGAGTFDTIWRNLLATREAIGVFEITLRVHLSPRNTAGVMRLIDTIADTFGHDPRYRILLKQILRLGGPNDGDITSLASDTYHRLLSAIRERCFGIITIGTDDECSDYICYAAKLNSLLIRPDGRIGKCSVALNDEDNIVGILRTDGSMNLDRAKLMAWAGGLFTHDREQLGCPLSFKQRATRSGKPGSYADP